MRERGCVLLVCAHCGYVRCRTWLTAGVVHARACVLHYESVMADASADGRAATAGGEADGEWGKSWAEKLAFVRDGQADNAAHLCEMRQCVDAAAAALLNATDEEKRGAVRQAGLHARRRRARAVVSHSLLRGGRWSH